MTIGDILAVIASIVLVAMSWGATLVTASLLFSDKINIAEKALREQRRYCLGRGLLTFSLIGFIAFIIWQGPGIFKLIALGLWGYLFLLAVIGSSAAVRIMDGRISNIGADLSPFNRLVKATSLYVLTGFVPLIGWFIVTPVLAILSIGAGTVAMKKQQYASVQNTALIPAAATNTTDGNVTVAS